MIAPRRRIRLAWLLSFALVACLLAESLQQSGALDSIDRRVQDFWFQWQGQRVAPRHVGIVALDEETLQAYPDDPLVFMTDRWAVALARLRQVGARAVALDMLFSFSPERWLGKLGRELQDAARDYDRPFREELARGGVVLAATRAGTGERESDYLLPSPDYLLALPDLDLPGYLGLADLLDESDGVVRRFLVAPIAAEVRRAVAGSVPVLGLPTLAALRGAGLDPRAGPWSLAGRELTLDQPAAPIPYIGPPGSFRPVSLGRLLADGALQDPEVLALRGKVVLIGATAAFNDVHFTPYAARLFAGRGHLMTGVEIHANVAESLLSGDRLEALAATARLPLLLLLSAAAVWLFATLRPWLGGIVGSLGLALLVGGGYFAFLHGVLVPLTAFVIATATALLSVLVWRLTGEERERARVRQMFGRYVSNQVVESLLQEGARIELGGQSQVVTVLFSDIRNFTTISEKLNAREVVEMLNTYFGRACEAVLAEGGSIDKFIGDAIMVEFGSPLPVADHAARGARAAVALRQVASDFTDWMQARFPDRGLPGFAIGIGLHSGEAVIGNIGAPMRMEFTAIGDTVNLASRLEGMTKELGCAILASEATIAACGDVVMTGREEVIHVKGRAAPVKVFELVDVVSGKA